MALALSLGLYRVQDKKQTLVFPSFGFCSPAAPGAATAVAAAAAAAAAAVAAAAATVRPRVPRARVGRGRGCVMRFVRTERFTFAM